MLTHTQTMYDLPVLVHPSDGDQLHLVNNSPIACGVEHRSFGWADFPTIVASLEEEENALENTEEGLRFGHLDWQRAQVRPCEFEQIASLSSSCETSSTVRSNKSKARQGKTVTFSKLEVREHSIIVGDHPLATSLPVSLGWAHGATVEVIDIDVYENLKAGCRRSGSDIRMSYYERKNRLKRIGGLSESDIRRAERRFAQQKENEQLSQQNVPAAAFI